ncbi:hypothetical protein [Algoriphagus aquimarinus]|uniref:hypothetical protein n=1 Tax=Algoriphagus aquimarinus TaxID=237018 RepID=UPI0030D9758A|tara:strand:- start:42692 stop:42976 length:285 start_codon:yes stop_codon:yes gene_type:complete
MTKAVLLVAIMMSSTVVFSQATLKGPRAKNATAIELAAHASPPAFYVVPIDIKGPEAKNSKVWEVSNKSTKTAFVRRNKDLKGPKAKNKKVWED